MGLQRRRGFLPTKNKSSVRKIQIDWQIVVKFSELTKNLPEDKPIFIGDKKFIIPQSMMYLPGTAKNVGFQKFPCMDSDTLMSLFCYLQVYQLPVWLDALVMQA